MIQTSTFTHNENLIGTISATVSGHYTSLHDYLCLFTEFDQTRYNCVGVQFLRVDCDSSRSRSINVRWLCEDKKTGEIFSLADLIKVTPSQMLDIFSQFQITLSNFDSPEDLPEYVEGGLLEN